MCESTDASVENLTIFVIKFTGKIFEQANRTGTHCLVYYRAVTKYKLTTEPRQECEERRVTFQKDCLANFKGSSEHLTRQ